MKPKPDYIKLELVLAFDDWKRLRTTPPTDLKPDEISALAAGVYRLVATSSPEFYLCSHCNTYNQGPLSPNVYGFYTCIKCDGLIYDRDKIINFHNL